MGDLDDTLKPEWLYGVASGPILKDVHHLKHLMKELNFAKHYGMGTAKIEEMLLQQYAAQDIEAVKVMLEKQMFPGMPAKQKPVGYIFLGGSLHGQRVVTDGHWIWETHLPVNPNFAGIWTMEDDLTLPTVGYTIEKYLMQKIMLPGHAAHGGGNYAEVYVLDDAFKMGTGYKDKLIADFMLSFFSPIENEVNTPVQPQLSEPTPAPPVPVSDGLRITIGGKTIEWTPDENQLEGLLSWAAQSLGPGKDITA